MMARLSWVLQLFLVILNQYMHEIKKQLLDAFPGIELEPIAHKYYIHKKDLKLSSVSKAKARYKKKTNWDQIQKAIAKRDNRTVDSIVEEWDFKKWLGNSKGTYLHEYIEYTLEGLGLPKWDPKVFDLDAFELCEYFTHMQFIISQADKYLEDFKQYSYIGSEIMMYDLDYGISGTFDKIYGHDEKGLCIRDYKTDKQFLMQDDPHKYRKNLTGPLSHLIDCEHVIYSLQQCIYKLILEKNTDLVVPVENIELVWFHPDNTTYKVYPILDLTKEAQEVLDIFGEEYKSGKKRVEEIKGIKF